MKTKLLILASCFGILFCHFAFAYPPYSYNYRLACNDCDSVDYYEGNSCDIYGCDMSYYNSRTPLMFTTSCSCTDPGAPANPCLNCGEFCHVFGNIGGRNYSDIYCCGDACI